MEIFAKNIRPTLYRPTRSSNNNSLCIASNLCMSIALRVNAVGPHRSSQFTCSILLHVTVRATPTSPSTILRLAKMTMYLRMTSLGVTSVYPNSMLIFRRQAVVRSTILELVLLDPTLRETAWIYFVADYFWVHSSLSFASRASLAGSVCRCIHVCYPGVTGVVSWVAVRLLGAAITTCENISRAWLLVAGFWTQAWLLCARSNANYNIF